MVSDGAGTTRLSGIRLPAATAAETPATVNGLASTLPWPMASAACSTGLSVRGMLPVKTPARPRVFGVP